MKLGAVRLEDGGIAVYLGCEWPWTGSARFDIPRHSEYFRMPYDYPRLNQFAEWFAVEDRTEYEIRGLTDEAQTYSGRELRNLSLKVAPEENLQMVIRKK
jgi:hypothetical protein